MRSGPFSSYRLQVHAGFDLDDAAALAGYLAALGITHVYTSPLLAAMPGSGHGYDGIDPTRFDDERGGEAGYRRFRTALRQQGLSHLLDIVPNHLAASWQNPWWNDVLRHGRDSRRAAVFDIDWEGGEGEGPQRLLVPILGRSLEEAVRAGEVWIDRDGDEPLVRAFEHRFPIAVERLADDDREALAGGGELDAARVLGILGRQHYRLCHWRRARGELNYRRFFDVSELAGVRQEDPEVFTATHGKVLELVAAGDVEGLRVDHVDGLRDPQEYLERLAASAGVFTVVEKILAPGETLPSGWPVAGTTGYDFAALAGGLFVDPAGDAPLTACWRDLGGERRDWSQVEIEAKEAALDRNLPAELQRLEQRFTDLLSLDGDSLEGGGEALRAVLARLPVYRTYLRPGGRASERDAALIGEAVAAARAAHPDLDGRLFARLAAALVGADPRGEDLALRFQQISAAVTAKGAEDTAFYVWTPLAALAEVGDHPARFGVSPASFHAHCRHRAECWPRSLAALSTHDSKRSADLRARLWLLSEVPDRWAAAVGRWHHHNARYRRRGADGEWPLPAAEHLLYQTLVGAWPLSTERAASYLVKAAREARQHTTWTAPDEAYEAALQGFVADVLADAGFQADLQAFVAPLIVPGRVNALAAQLLALTAPGTPDLYQGHELWDLSLVDPDNRRPVDWTLRRRLLDSLDDPSRTRGAWAPRLDGDDLGVSKLWTIRQALQLRRRLPGAFGPEGGYAPLAARGARARHVVAFLREGPNGELALTAVPRLQGAATNFDWEDTTLELPPGLWRNVLDGTARDGGEVLVSDLVAAFPVALCERAGEPPRRGPR